MEDRFDAVVVGAGISGLVAARELVAAGREVVVVEARDRVGGRTANHEVGGGRVIDLGAMWIAPHQERIRALIADLGVETFPTYNEGRSIALWADRRILYRGLMPWRINPLLLLDALQGIVRFDRMSRKVDLDAPWETPHADEWDGQTFETWIRRSLRSRQARDYFRIFAETIFATEATHFSLLHALFYARTSNGFETLMSVEGGAQQDRIRGGTQILSLRMAEQLGDRVRLKCPVTAIEQHDSGVRVCTGDAVFAAEHAIVAVPPALAGRIEYAPALPALRDQLTQRLPAGAVTRCMPIYEEPFWRADGLTGMAASDVGPVKLAYDCSPPEGSPGVLLAFLLAGDARRLGALSLDDRRRCVLESLARYFGDRALHPIDYVEKDWAADVWARGGYGAHLPPGVWTEFGPALRRPVGRIHWAGAETASTNMGQMDGAVEAGQRAADEVLAAVAAGERP